MPFPLFVLLSCAIAAATMGAVYALSPQRRDAAAAVALLGAFALLVFHGPGYFNHFPLDDAFITFRYSKHLADGLGPDWNSTGHVEGYSSFLWMALLAALHKLGMDIEDAARLLDYVTALGTLLAVVAIWRLWSREEPGSGIESPLVLAATLLAIALVDGIAFWGFSGMETPLFTFVLTAGALVFMRGRRSNSLVPWSAVAFAAVAMSRPEGIVAAIVTGAFTLDGVQDASTRRRALLRAATWAAAFAALFGAYFLWRYSYYGYLFPNTYYAKVETSSAIIQRGADYLAAGTLNYQVLPMYAGIAALLLLAPRLRRDGAYIAALSAALFLAIIPEGGDAFGHGRFIVPALPLLYLAGISGFAAVLARLSLETAQRAAAAGAVLVIAALLLLRGSNNPYIPEDRAAQAQRKTIGTWLSEHTPEDYTIAAWAIGSVAYHSDRNALDLLGLNDETIAHTKIEDFGLGIAGHERFNVDYVLEVVRPEIIVTGDGQDAPYSSDDFWRLAAMGTTLPAKTAIMSDPRLPQLYTLRAIELDGKWYNFLQRTDTVSQLNAPGLR
jgi:hypothetical protein